MSNNILTLTRAQLSSISKDPRIIRVLEQLLAQMKEINPEDLGTIKEIAEAAQLEAGTGSAKAQQAVDLLESIMGLLQEIATRPLIDTASVLEAAVAALQIASTMPPRDEVVIPPNPLNPPMDEVVLPANPLTPPQNESNILVADSLQLRQLHPTGRPLGIAETQWNPTVATLETRINDEMVLQHGQEVVRRMINNTLASIVPGQVIAFDSTSGDPEAPNGKLFIADGSISSLLLAGVATTTAAPGQIFYVTSYGVVHDVNTSTYVGSLLYASATTPGALTSTPPTAPDLYVPVASVLAVSPTAGHIFINPARYPRLYYGGFSDSTTQAIAAANTPQAVTMNTTNIASGFSRGTPTSRIVAANNGVYNFDFSLQMSSSTASSIKAVIWARINGVDVVNSATEITIKSNTDIVVPSWNFTERMNANDYFQLMIAADSTNLSLAASAAQAVPYPRPAIPSIILSVTQANQ